MVTYHVDSVDGYLFWTILMICVIFDDLINVRDIVESENINSAEITRFNLGLTNSVSSCGFKYRKI